MGFGAPSWVGHNLLGFSYFCWGSTNRYLFYISVIIIATSNLIILFLGQRDKYKIQVEQGLPFFPYDYPDTRAYATQSILTAKQKAIIYFKKPPAKRTNYKKLGIFSPFRYSATFSDIIFILKFILIFILDHHGRYY